MVRAAGDACDVIVIGGGPAGSAAARSLASWGWSVLLLHAPDRRPSLAESLPPSTRKLLAQLGQLDAVDRAGFHPNHGNVARWAERSRATRTDAPGVHVRRADFDRVLRDAASAAGACSVEAVVRRVDPGDPVRVTFSTPGGGLTTAYARQVLDCSGRVGLVARRGFRRDAAPYRTVAIAAEWHCPAWPDAERAHTLVESYADGWAWSVPLSPTRRQCTVMIDRASARDGGCSGATYEREIAKTTAIRERLTVSRAVRLGAPWARDASMYDSSRAADESVVLVGDAASFVEPLSSAGVKKALLSAWRAAIVANTCLKQPSLASAARSLYSQREGEVFADCARGAAAFFAEAAAAYGSPFWSARAGYAHAAAAGGEAAFSDEALARDAGVRAAFAYLRAADAVRLRTSDALQIHRVAAIEGREVVLRDAVVLPGADRAIPFAAGVDLPALARLARGGRDVPALIAAYHAEIGPAPVSGLLTGLSLLVARHALVAEGSPS